MSHFWWTVIALCIVIMVPSLCHSTSYMLVICVHNVSISTFVLSSCTLHTLIYTTIHTYTHSRHSLEITGRNERERNRRRMPWQVNSSYANDKYQDCWMLGKNVNPKPTVNSTALSPTDGNKRKKWPSFKGATLPLSQPPGHEQRAGTGINRPITDR